MNRNLHHTRCATSHRLTARKNHRAFTLAELTVVIAVVLILLSITLPAASVLWNQRKTVEAENILKGILNNARTRAISAAGVETGLFFFVDPEGVQHIAPIQQDDPSDLLKQNVFRFSGERDNVLPPPMRVCPRYAVQSDTGNNAPAAYLTFSPFELSNNLFEPIVSTGLDVGQRHRNFFTLIYGKDGQLTVWRDVLILDPLPAALSQSQIGPRSGLSIGQGPGHEAVRYYKQNDSVAGIDPTGANRPVANLIQAPASGHAAGTAINFLSADGILLYDDQEYRDNVNFERQYLLRKAQPFYIGRVTGEVIRGAVGEGV